ncbi:MAG TPA: baseplate J/gp47 family protein, partial [Candidatus Limnocylindrales bacterium]
PRQEPLGPVQMVITADTTATQADANARVIPASQVSVPVSVNDTFQATGKRVQLSNATGTVRFENLDPTASNRIASGSIVRTPSGIRFRTAVTVTVPAAALVGFQIFPSRASVKVTAVDGGTDGNVDANTIVVVPNGENPVFLKVTNPNPTIGGTSQEFARITQADVDGAMTALDTSLHEAFTEALAKPSLVSGGATVFPATGTLGTTKPTLDPATLVGQEIATFDLGLSATGTVITADTTPINGIADTQLRAAVKPDHELVAGSAGITVGGAVVTGQTVTFPVSATAKQVALLDPGTLKAKVLGKSVADAKAILSLYGDVRLTVSPDWTGSVPSFESRVDLTVQGAVPVETPGPSSPSGSSTP